jgi:ribosomal protein L7/L12
MLVLLGLATVLVLLVGVLVALVWRRRFRAAVAASMQSDARIMVPPKSAVLRQVNDAEIEAHIRSGHVINAITLYREKTGVSVSEAKVAVEAWRDRIRAS